MEEHRVGGVLVAESRGREKDDVGWGQLRVGMRGGK
jgi:hypothetical protein